MQSQTALAILSDMAPSLPLYVVLREPGKAPKILDEGTVVHFMTQLMRRPPTERVMIYGTTEINITKVTSVRPRHGGPEVAESVEVSAWRT